MFGNIFYFIIALLIYSTYPVSDQPNFPPLETALFFAATALGFAGLVWMRFKRLAHQSLHLPLRVLSPVFETVQTRLSILAMGVFALDIYGLSLPSYLSRVRLMAAVPTIQALVFLLLFMGYLVLIWIIGHGLYRRINNDTDPLGEYVRSNIQLCTPVLLPWLALSGFSDLLKLLPFPALHRFLASAPGEITYFITFLLVVSILGPVIIQKFWQCRPLAQGPDRMRIENLCRRAQVRYADILTWPLFGGRMMTAAVMGLIGRFRYILVTPALMNFLRPEEIDSVIAHEIGHVKHRHLLLYLLFFTGYMLLSFVTLELIPYAVIYFPPLYHWIEKSGLAPDTVITTLFSIGVIAVFLFYFRIIFGYFMRNFERQADAHVYAMFDSALPMISTFEKIAITSGHPPDKPNWHHFSIAQRIGFLKKCEADPWTIQRHHRKIRLSLALYIVCLVVVAATAWSMNFGDTGRRMSSQAFERILEREIEKNPTNTDLFTTLGDLYFDRGDTIKAMNAYEHAIRLHQTNARALNNLAWILATCQDPRLRAPARALELARRAVALHPAPHALDTLAEAYFANGDITRAIATEKLALKRAKTNRQVFLDQLAKFEKALKEE